MSPSTTRATGPLCSSARRSFRKPSSGDTVTIESSLSVSATAPEVAPGRAGQDHRRVGERGVAAGWEEAEMQFRERVRHQIAETERHSGDQAGKPVEDES